MRLSNLLKMRGGPLSPALSISNIQDNLQLHSFTEVLPVHSGVQRPVRDLGLALRALSGPPPLPTQGCSLTDVCGVCSTHGASSSSDPFAAWTCLQYWQVTTPVALAGCPPHTGPPHRQEPREPTSHHDCPLPVAMLIARWRNAFFIGSQLLTNQARNKTQRVKLS